MKRKRRSFWDPPNFKFAHGQWVVVRMGACRARGRVIEQYDNVINGEEYEITFRKTNGLGAPVRVPQKLIIGSYAA